MPESETRSADRTTGILTLVPSLTAGLVVGLLEVILAISLAALVYAGDLADYMAAGIGMTLVTTIVASSIVALLTTLPGTVNGIQDLPAAIMAVMAAAMAARLSAGMSGETVFATVSVTIGLATVSTGAVLFILGRLRLGKLVRFLPYPVIGGFLAGTGWLLIVGAVAFMVDGPVGLADVPGLFEAGALWYWLPGVLLGVALLISLERFENGLIMPALVLSGVALFYLVAAGINGLSPGALTAQGWLLGPFPTDSLWPSSLWGDLGLVHWPTVLSQLPSVGTLVVLSAVGLLLNATGLELAARQDVSLDRELTAAGIGNMVGGLFGGLIGYQQLGLSAFALRQGARKRLVGLVGAAVCLAALVVGTQLLGLIPKVVVGGILFYLGLDFLKVWVLDTWNHLPRVDYVIVVSILGIIALVGILEGVVAGFLATVVMFVVAYSRIEVVRRSLTGRHVSSRTTRSPAVRRHLDAHADRLRILQLQGFIFFGTAERLLDRVRAMTADETDAPFEFLLLDFRRVTGMDSTAMLSFTKLGQLAANHGATLIIVQSAPAIRRQLQRGGLADQHGARYFARLEQAINWCEEEILQRLDTAMPADDGARHAHLAAIGPGSLAWERLHAVMDVEKFDAGEALIRQGESPDSLFFIESGQVTAQLERSGAPPVRLESMGRGRVVGELGLYLGQMRTATVRADEETVVYRLTRETLDRLERDDPGVAAALHRVIVHLLAERVTHLIAVVGDLEE